MEENKKNDHGMDENTKLAVIAEIKYKHVKYKIASDMQGDAQRRMKAVILRRANNSNQYFLVENDEEKVAVWKMFTKLYKDGEKKFKEQGESGENSGDVVKIDADAMENQNKG